MRLAFALALLLACALPARAQEVAVQPEWNKGGFSAKFGGNSDA